MASAQWKNFQPPNQDGGMSAFQRSSSFSEQSNNSNNVSSSNNSLRETGIIEKLLHSYGFIQCCEKQARLFFHYSQFCGNIEHLKFGDAVEFETTYDRKTGKPIAREVVKLSPESLSDEVLSEERVSGLVTTEIKNGNEGRIAYENRGECFFLPYSGDDVDSGLVTDFQTGDKVTFLISPDKQTGNPRARNVRIEKARREHFQGVVCSLKETFGFIERSDVVKKIFFHASECKDFKEMSLGDDVAFYIQTRNNKEVATNVASLPAGTVVFEDVSNEAIMGQVIKITDRYQSRQSSDPLSGKIRYRRNNNQNEIQFGDNDTKGDYTLQVGDWVQFNIAVDRRDKLQRATNIELLNESFIVSGEKREQGVVMAIKDSYGFIQRGSAQQQGSKNSRNDSNRIFFRLCEMLDPEQPIKMNDEVEFTIVQDSTSPNRSHAIRVRALAPGTLTLESTSPSYRNGTLNHEDSSFLKKYVGKVEREPEMLRSKGSRHSQGHGDPEDDENSSNGSSSSREGSISYQVDGENRVVTYQAKECDKKNRPKIGEKVEFLLDSDLDVAREVRLTSQNGGLRNGYRYTHRGYIAALKDSFGFIETQEHDREIFFHFNVYDGNPLQLDLGQEVEYSISTKGSKVSAECVSKLSQGTIPREEEIKPDILNGVVLRPVRCFNPEQDEYSGLIKLAPELKEIAEEGDDEGNYESIDAECVYPFGITSLQDKHDFLQKGDAVQFQVGIEKSMGQERALNVTAIRAKLQATVEAIRGNFGFLSHEAEEGKKLFFHMSEVKNNETLQTGDRVEFILMHNQRTGKHSACSVLKIGDGQPSQRPERLLNRLRTISMDEGGPRIIVLRQPKGPDGGVGFKNPRSASTNEPTLEKDNFSIIDS